MCSYIHSLVFPCQSVHPVEIAAAVSYVHLNHPSRSKCGDLTRVSNGAKSRELARAVLRLLLHRGCSSACAVLRFSFASLVLDSTGARLILWIRSTFCAQMAFLTAAPTNNVLVWIRTLVLMLTFFLDVLTITFPLLAFLALLATFVKAVHLHRI